MVPYTDINTGEVLGTGLMCCASTDEKFVGKWGKEHWHKQFSQFGLETCWGYDKDSGVLPCSVYLRHCTLAASNPNVDPRVRGSFLDETYLVDRQTTIRSYLEQNPGVMETRPPEDLEGRYSG